ncbi:hypothetical protein [Deinococcus altitudinis]|uniref:hypothetical protein n=1 Tax=Deinococcus altitudinis TaxID=468914 RepID=UPI0038921289
MNSARVISEKGDGTWANRGSAHRHKKGGGWNVLLNEGTKDWTVPLVLMDAGGLAAGTTLRVMVTRPAVEGGTDWFEVGRAWVSKAGRAVIAQIEVKLPSDETKLVLLPQR